MSFALPDASTEGGRTRVEYRDADFAHVLADFDQTTTLLLEGPAWNDTLVRDCRIHDTGGDGIVLRDVKNVVITRCELFNLTGHSAIRASVTGTTDGLVIEANVIHDVQNNGINLPQRAAEGVRSTNARVVDNVIFDTGLGQSSGATHHVYNQSPDTLIEGNVLRGVRDGNAISERSSGLIRCNTVEGTSKSGKPGIRYFSDHTTGPEERLTIAENRVTGQSIGVDLVAPVSRYDGATPPGHVVKRFVLSGNVLAQNGDDVAVAQEYSSAPYSVQRD